MTSRYVSNSEAFKNKARIVQGGGAVVGIDNDSMVREFRTWLTHSRSHYVVMQSDDEPLHNVLVLAASLVYTSQPVSLTTLVFDPVILIDRLFNTSFQDVNVIYLYDIQLLGVMPEYEVRRFFSYIKWALTQDVRCVIPIDCVYDRDVLGRFFGNKRVADELMQVLSDTRYCSRLEV